MDEPEKGNGHDEQPQEAVPQTQNPVLLIVSWHSIRMAIMRSDKDTDDRTLVGYQNALNRVENLMHEYAVGVYEEAAQAKEAAEKKKGDDGGQPALRIVKP